MSLIIVLSYTTNKLLSKGIERNTFTIQQYGRMCSEMHKGISENRTEIIRDKEAASCSRL